VLSACPALELTKVLGQRLAESSEVVGSPRVIGFPSGDRVYVFQVRGLPQGSRGVVDQNADPGPLDRERGAVHRLVALRTELRPGARRRAPDHVKATVPRESGLATRSAAAVDCGYAGETALEETGTMAKPISSIPPRLARPRPRGTIASPACRCQRAAMNPLRRVRAML
jgi:hypothetical protein